MTKPRSSSEEKAPVRYMLTVIRSTLHDYGTVQIDLLKVLYSDTIATAEVWGCADQLAIPSVVSSEDWSQPLPIHRTTVLLRHVDVPIFICVFQAWRFGPEIFIHRSFIIHDLPMFIRMLNEEWFVALMDVKRRHL